MPLKDWKEESKDPALVAAMQEICLSSFKHFCLAVFEFVYRKTFIWSEHHDIIATHLMEVWTGQTRNLVINVAPRYSKSEMLTLFAAWTYAHNPRCEFLHLSYSDGLAETNSDKVRTIIKSKFYFDLFKVEIDKEYDSKGVWHTTEGGIFRATATGGQVTGFGAGSTVEFDEEGKYVFSGMVWIDDPLKPSDAHTTRRVQVNAHWDETIKSRRNSPDSTPTVCIMQRLHEDDFTTTLLADTGERFKHLKLKTLKDDGTALWPRKHTVSVLEKMRETNEFVYSAQYQQEPTPVGGSVFRSEWWGFYTASDIPDLNRVIIVADTAMKTEEHHDYSVFQAWGFCKQQGRIFLLDQQRGKWAAPDLKRIAAQFISAIRAKYHLESVFIEDKASGTGLIQSIGSETTAAIIPIQRNKDKVTRSFETTPHVQARQVFLPEGRDFTDMFIAEASSFSGEMKHLHDDMVDCLCDAVSILLDAPEISMWDVL